MLTFLALLTDSDKFKQTSIVTSLQPNVYESTMFQNFHLELCGPRKNNFLFSLPEDIFVFIVVALVAWSVGGYFGSQGPVFKWPTRQKKPRRFSMNINEN